ncbi:unnamed protein product [Ectocarpus sp. 12 AP-2014]
MKLACCVLVWACALAARVAEAFVPALAGRAGIMSAAGRQASMSPAAAGRQSAFSHTSFGSPAQTPSSRWLSGRPSPGASTTTMGLFGLGAPEIAVCIAVAALILGPDKMAGFAKDMGKMAGELKDVPKEFQAGVQEGEAKTQKTIMEIESNGLAVDAEPATKKEEEKA